MTVSVPVDSGASVTVTGPVVAGHLENPEITEASGLAPSRRADGILWVHNDSGNEPAIYAISPTGKHLGAVWPAGADNIDWEDIESFVLGGRAYILIADLGDNNAKRKNCSFYVIEEPDPALLSPEKDLIVPIAWQVPVAYRDGPHDCEAVAVDPGSASDGSEGKVYILLKREYPPRLFTVPLRPAPLPRATGAAVSVGSVGGASGAPGAPGTRSTPGTRNTLNAPGAPDMRSTPGTPNTPNTRSAPNTLSAPNAPSAPSTPNAPDIPAQTAWQIGKLAEIPQPGSVRNLLPIPTGQYRGDPTGMSFSPDGRFAVVLTYGDVLLYPRREGESWLSALLRKPLILPPHKLGQAEAVCFSRDGKSIFVTEEAPRAPLLRYDLK